jgi:hypothetical protein
MKNNYSNARKMHVRQFFSFLSLTGKKEVSGMGKGALLLLFFLFVALNAQAYDFPGGDGSAEDPYQIATKADMNGIKEYLGSGNAGKHFRQTADLDLGAWVPIGSGTTVDTHFCGNFDGGGYKILNITTDAGYGGLFGVADAGAVIENVHIVGGSISRTSPNSGVAIYQGSVVGYIVLTVPGDVIIRNNINRAAVNGNQTQAAGSTHVGGIVGYAYGINTGTASGTITVEGNVNLGNITGNGQRTGGIVGYAYANLESVNFNISSNYNGGDVTGMFQTPTSTATASTTGGIIGHLNLNKANTNAVISNNVSYAKIETTCPGGQSYIGGITGFLQASGSVGTAENMKILFDKNFAGGSVIANSANTALRAGGLVGCTSRGLSTLDIQYSVAAQTRINRTGTTGNRIYGSALTGGAGSVINYTSNYAYKDLEFVNESGTTTVTSSTAHGTDKTLAELLTKATYADAPLSWDFETVWQAENGITLPYLRSQVNRTGINDLYLPLLQYTYDGQPAPEEITFIGAEPPLVTVPGRITEVNFILTPPEKGQANLEQNTLTLSQSGIENNKVFTVSESGIHAHLFFQVTNIVSIYENGTGTEDDPYIITNQTQLESVKDYLSKHFKLANDIELTFSDGSTGWTPIAEGNPATATAFTGSLNGDGHKITGLWSESASVAQGLFGKSSGVIKNLAIALGAEGITAGTATAYAGGLVGYVTGGNITACYVTGAEGAQIGGASEANGGLVGTIAGTTTITDSYAAIDVNSPETGAPSAGGLVGSITDASSQITRSYATGSIAGSGAKGGLVGTAETGQIVNSFALSEDEQAAALTKEAADYAAWDLENSDVWGIYNTYGYPYLKAFGNEILITPIGGSTSIYNGAAATVSYAWTADNYDETVYPITGQPAIDEEPPLVNVGTYTFTPGTLDLKNPYYQISFKDDVSIVINPANQSITFTPTTSLDLKDGSTYTLSATATSGLPVLFRLREADAEYAEIDGNQLTLNKVGTIEVTAYVESDANYTEATEVPVTIEIIHTGTGLGTVQNTLTTTVVNGILKIGGLASGEQIAVYNAQGITIHRQTAQLSGQDILLPARGIYIVVIGEKKTKIVY